MCPAFSPSPGLPPPASLLPLLRKVELLLERSRLRQLRLEEAGWLKEVFLSLPLASLFALLT